MCTSVSYKTKDHYFGRTLDYEFSYGESIVITPRNFPFSFRCGERRDRHYAMIGMAHMADGSPLYYEATNEKGLSMAGLNFPGYAVYHAPAAGRDNVAPFELIWWILGDCASVGEARSKLDRLNVTAWNFRADMPATPLHWMLADEKEALVIESMADGLHIHENPVGVMTNSPPFDYHMLNLAAHRNLSREPAENRFAPGLPLADFSRGMGGIGLPGDLSSPSRFVRCAFTRLNSVAGDSEEESVSQFFHILGSVAHARGSVDVGNGQYEITIYTSCCNTNRGIYYYTTYENSRITAVDMHRENLEGAVPFVYPMLTKTDIFYQNT